MVHSTAGRALDCPGEMPSSRPLPVMKHGVLREAISAWTGWSTIRNAISTYEAVTTQNDQDARLPVKCANSCMIHPVA
jgi:hypothetical protein